MRWNLLTVAAVVASTPIWAAQPHSVRGILLKADPARHTIVVSCEAVPGYMDAMVMPFIVRGPADFKALVPGTEVRFKMLEHDHHDYAEHLEIVTDSNYESEPTEAGRLTFLHRTIDPNASAKIVPIGHAVPDFTLTDQARQPTRLSQFKGKVVALTFAYSRCPNPNYCFRLSNNLSILKRRFHARAGTDLVLITIVIDPDQDRDQALARFANTWKADPAEWHFLTGSVADIQNVAERFGMNFWSDEGFLTHSFHTIVIDRDGKLAANLEGNQFTAAQLGDLVNTVLRQPAHEAAASQ